MNVQNSFNPSAPWPPWFPLGVHSNASAAIPLCSTLTLSLADLVAAIAAAYAHGANVALTSCFYTASAQVTSKESAAPSSASGAASARATTAARPATAQQARSPAPHRATVQPPRSRSFPAEPPASTQQNAERADARTRSPASHPSAAPLTSAPRPAQGRRRRGRRGRRLQQRALRQGAAAHPTSSPHRRANTDADDLPRARASAAAAVPPTAQPVVDANPYAALAAVAEDEPVPTTLFSQSAAAPAVSAASSEPPVLDDEASAREARSVVYELVYRVAGTAPLLETSAAAADRVTLCCHACRKDSLICCADCGAPLCKTHADDLRHSCSAFLTFVVDDSKCQPNTAPTQRTGETPFTPPVATETDDGAVVAVELDVEMKTAEPAYAVTHSVATKFASDQHLSEAADKSCLPITPLPQLCGAHFQFDLAAAATAVEIPNPIFVSPPRTTNARSARNRARAALIPSAAPYALRKYGSVSSHGLTAAVK